MMEFLQNREEIFEDLKGCTGRKIQKNQMIFYKN